MLSMDEVPGTQKVSIRLSQRTTLVVPLYYGLPSDVKFSIASFTIHKTQTMGKTKTINDLYPKMQ